MWGVVAVVVPALFLIAWLVREALMRSDRASRAEVACARAEGVADVQRARADTAERLRRAETMRADTLEEELSRHDQALADHPDASARLRVRERWRLSADLAAASADRGDEGPVPEPAAADAEPATDPSRG